MYFRTYGDKNKKSILFIHGMATTARTCYEPLLEYLQDYYVILAEIDGHSEKVGELHSVADNCTEIEKYVISNLDGKLFCLSGFSLGGTMAVEIASRGNILIEKLHLDAAFLVEMGWKTKPFEAIFCKAIQMLQNGKKIPKPLMDSVMGKDNNSVVEMLYHDITKETILRACEYVYRYKLDARISIYPGPIRFWYGTNETYPPISAGRLKKLVPQMEVTTFKGMGHGQYLHEHSREYAELLREYLEK